MRSRPWPIVILALLHILGPLGNVFLSSWVDHMTPREYIVTFFRTQNLWMMIDFFVLLPLAGVAIWICKKWSYPIFLIIALETMASNFWSWKHHSAVYPLWVLVLVFVLDILFVGYFLVPAVRVVYMDPKLRWWESKPRFVARIRTTLTLADKADKKATAMITDISEGGVFIKCATPLELNQPIHLQFSIFGKRYALTGKAVYTRIINPKINQQGYGIQFSQENEHREQLQSLRKLARGMDLAGLPRRNAFDWKEDFKNWAISFLKTGRGFFPQRNS